MERQAGQGYGYRGSRNHGEHRSESSESRGGRHGKRKREDERKEKDDRQDKKKEKHKGKDEKAQKEDRSTMKEEKAPKDERAQAKDERTHREDRAQTKEEKSHRDDRSLQKEDRSHAKEEKSHRQDRPHAKDERGHRDDKGHVKEDKAHRKNRLQGKEEKGHRGREAAPPSHQDSPGAERERERSPHQSQSVKAKAKTWRDEAENKDEDERDLSDDDEEVQRKLTEARKRRQDLMKKAAAEKQPDQVEASAADRRSPDHAPAQEDKTDEAKASTTKVPASDADQEAEGGGMFDDSAAAGDELNKQVKQTAAIGHTGASGEDWDDEEGYYVPKLDELMDDRWLVVETAAGKGVFSGVVKCRDRRGGPDALVAVKVIRANDRMTKAAELEVSLLNRLNKADKDGTSHIIRLHDTFVYRKHFCLVFESMWGDLRTALKTFTKNKGMTLLAVRSYTKQLLSALRHMLKCKIVHCDIKPDNILISKGHNAVKFCDLGTAVEISGVNATPYLGSGYYRSPEIVLGCEWGYPVDTWALAATLSEIFTGKVLMPSKTNNQHLKLIMEFKGKLPGKVIKKGQPLVWKNHFTDNLDFKYQEPLGKLLVQEEDKDEDAEPQTVIREITDLAATKSIKDLLMNRVGPEKRASTKFEDKEYVTRAGQFADLLELMLSLDPDKRINPSDALQHSFCQDLGKKKT